MSTGDDDPCRADTSSRGNGGHAKFWLDGPRLEKAAGYNRPQLMQITGIIEAPADEFKARWHAYFD